MQMQPILVGVDGSPESLAAVDLAAREVILHRRPLRLVHAFVWPTLGVYVGPSPEGPPEGGLAADADRLLAGAVDRARAGAGEREITGEIVTGAVVPVLLAEADHAAMVVLGSRGLGGFAELLLGSVAAQVAAYGSCPVLVVRGQPRQTGPVVVGVDGSPAAAAALRFGFAEAAVRGAELLALTTWSRRLPEEVEQQLPLVYDSDDVDEAHARLLAEAVAAAAAESPGVVVRQQVRRSRAAPALLEASAPAQLVVVGARGRGGFLGSRIGSVSHALLHHAECPVAVVRAEAAGTGG